MGEYIYLFFLNFVQNFPVIFAGIVALKLFLMKRYGLGAPVIMIGCLISSTLIIVIDNYTLKSGKPPFSIPDIIIATTIYTIFGIITTLILAKLHSLKLISMVAIVVGASISLIYVILYPGSTILEYEYVFGSILICIFAFSAMRRAADGKNMPRLLISATLISLLMTIPYFVLKLPYY